MKCFALLSTVIVASFLLLPPAQTHAIPLCGYVLLINCPGCTPNYPSDSSCFCGEDTAAETCNCMKQSGRQTESTIFCWIGNFDYTENEDAPKIVEAGAQNCKTVYKCVKPAGGGLNCGTLPSCASTGSCSWQIFATTQQMTYAQGGECD